MEESTINYKELIPSINIPVIDDDCRFWMVRSKEGFFYHEFISQGFIAIGWNTIKQNNISENEDGLKKSIKDIYGESVPGSALNKCKNFISHMKKDDIVIVVGKNEIAFAKLGDYYEINDESFNYTKELEVHEQIKTKKIPDYGFVCPYAKRRHIEVIRTLPLSSITPLLYKVMAANRHSLSEITERTDTVLESAYDVFYYHDKLSLVFHVDKTDPISTKELSQFLYYSSELFSSDITTKASVHSPGEIILTASEFAESELFALINIWFSLGGGTVLKHTLSPLVKHIPNIFSYRQNQQLKDMQIKEKELELEDKEVEIEGKRIKNEREKEALKHDQLENQKTEIEIEKEKFALEQEKLKTYQNFIESAEKLKVRPLENRVFSFKSPNEHTKDEEKKSI